MAIGQIGAAHRFANGLKADALLTETSRVHVELFGSLGATGHGHGSDKAVLLGLSGEEPETVDTDSIPQRVGAITASHRLALLGSHEIDFQVDRDLVLHRRRALPFHPNGMTFTALNTAGTALRERTYYSVGGGFVVDEKATGADRVKVDETPVAYPFRTGTELLAHTSMTGLSISDIMLANERAWRSEEDVRSGVADIWRTMQDCVTRGCTNDGSLPGGLKVRRRAAEMHRVLSADGGSS